MLRREVRSELAVPLEVMGEVRGVLNVDADREDAFSEADQELLEELAVQAAKVIHNTWLFEQSRLKARLLETLVSVSQTINSTLNLNEALPSHHPRSLHTDGSQTWLRSCCWMKAANCWSCAPATGRARLTSTNPG